MRLQGVFSACCHAVLVVACASSHPDTERDAGGPASDADAGADSGFVERVEGWLSTPLEPFPETLSEVGIYPGAQNPSRPAASAYRYEPSSQLWSNSLSKERALVLPGGARVNADSLPWTFPMGTLFFKTFSDRNGPIETRVLRRIDDDFDYAVYQWNDARDEAVLLDGRLNIDVEASTDQGTITHTIPSTLTCRQCHESSATAVLGFDSMQLYGQLDSLQDTDAVFDSEPVLADPFRDVPAESREAVRYFVGNCVHCHNGGRGLATSFDLRPEVALGNLVDQPTNSSATAPGIRVVPGQPNQSILFQAVSGETDSPDVKDMPPEGVQLRDHAAVEMLRTWIERL